MNDGARQENAQRAQRAHDAQQDTIIRLLCQIRDRLDQLGQRGQGAIALEGTITASAGGQCCQRCGQLLNSVSPGYSAVSGGYLVCAICLRPGEEILRARGL